MKLWQWLKEHDARANITLEAAFDPAVSPQQWRCEIGGYSNTDRTRPAVFIQTFSNTAVAIAPTPAAALRAAVRKLRGRKVNIVYRGERDETFTFPDDLTV